MGAAALTARTPFQVAKEAERAACGLAFDALGGPLIAVCGLVGGCGASTLAFNLARQAARESTAPVLLTEAAARSGGIAVLAGHATDIGLLDLARQVAESRAPDRSFAELEPRFRLLASRPQHVAQAQHEHVGALLRDARAAHGLVIVDCGTDWPAASQVLNQASHIVWALPATRSAVERARLLFTSDLVPRPGSRVELLAATALHSPSAVKVRSLRRLAGARCERLVLIPHSKPLARGELSADGEYASRALTGLASALRNKR